MGDRQGRSLRYQLLLPVLLLMILVVCAVQFAQSSLARQRSESLIDSRGDTIRAALEGRISERRSAEEGFARMLAEHQELASATQAGDKAALAQLLDPLRAGVAGGQLAVYGKDGFLLQSIGHSMRVSQEDYLIGEALAGWTPSIAVTAPGGILVLAAAPIYGSADTVGALIVGEYLGGPTLATFRGSENEQVAVLRPDHLVVSTSADPDLTQILEQLSDGQNNLNARLASLHQRAVIQPLADGGVIVSIFGIGDILQTTTAMHNAALIALGVLTGLLVLLGVYFARAIARPLEAMAHVTREISDGNYRRRVSGSRIRELNDLALAFNHMAGQMDRQLAELSHQALHDPLTGLPNRAMLLDRLGAALSGSQQQGPPVAVIVLDLDNFKVINDSLGHASGDEVLVLMARRLQQAVEPLHGLAARLGGDEFAILLDHIACPADATELAERLGAALGQPVIMENREIVLGASMGVSFGTPGTHHPEDLLKAADLAAYKVKAGGKGGYAVFDQSMGRAAMVRLELETDLRRAVERGEFRVWYQPIVDLQTGRVAEVEALVRWQHPERGMVSPADFIPLAEETGLIVPLGRWVLTEACQQGCLWLDQLPGGEQIVIGVNLSARQVGQPGLVEEVAHALAETGLPPECLKLEITESVMMRDAEATVRTLRRLKALGVLLAVDDFGQGYSSLSYLKRFPLDVLKIDRAFIEKLGQNPQDTAIVETIIRLAHTLNLATTGEGVENLHQMELLREMGCERGQGYYFARPVPSESVLDLLLTLPVVAG